MKPRSIATQRTPEGVQNPDLALDQGESLLEEAQEAENAQTALLENVDAQYSGALVSQVEAKHDQAERIEDKLENLIDTQNSRLQQTLTQQPGFMALPSTKQRWQQQVQQQQNSLQRLQGRLETVREIKDGMGIHGPRIEELATRKLKALDPGLVGEWEDMQEAQRKHQALLRQQEQERKRQQRQTQQQGGGQALSVSLPR